MASMPKANRVPKKMTAISPPLTVLEVVWATARFRMLLAVRKAVLMAGILYVCGLWKFWVWNGSREDRWAYCEVMRWREKRM